MAGENERTVWISRVAETVRRADPRAFLVPPRIVRRVIRQERDLPGVGFRVPHRKSYVLSGNRIGHFVAKDELGLTVAEDYPAHVFLLSEPKESELQGMTEADLRHWAWRLLFHTRIHFEYDRLLADEKITPAEVRAAIDAIGQVEFDEAESVLQRESFLIGRPNRMEVFQEFAAVYWEYRYFSPERLPWYFPSLPDYERVDGILRRTLDPAALLEETRLPHAAESEPAAPPVRSDRGKRAGAESAGTAAAKPPAEMPPSLKPRRYRRLTAAAGRAAGRGNTARSAMLYARAAPFGTPDETRQARQSMGEQLDRFTDRLRRALQFDDEDARKWREILEDLLRCSGEGFWNADRRLLYDLQKVCVDNERTVYKIDLFEWARTRGRRPVKRPLPFQQEVLSVKHIRGAMGRLKSSRISEEHRETLSALMREAIEVAERRFRERVRPVVDRSLRDAGLRPAGPTEEVALKKLIEEILDDVGKRGYMNMGSLRDAISRNRIKLDDLSGPEEFFRGDTLLRANRKLAEDLDGVYRRGEFYLRWLQRLSSVAFGTQTGRRIMLFALLPFGGAFIVLTFVGHLLEKIGLQAHALSSWTAIFLAGLFLLGLMHWTLFRKVVQTLLSWTFRFLAAIFIDMPFWAIRNPEIRQFLRSPPVVALRRFVITPAILALLLCVALPRLGLYAEPPLLGTLGVYLLLAAALNSRIGRDFEELSADWIEHTWYQIRTRVFVAFFEWVMGAFKTMLEFVERCLYAVDEWLRFRSGESQLTFGVKAVFGLFWAGVAFVATFAITLLIEPQINPIKHFPVVTVSHKIILPMEPMIHKPLEAALGDKTAHLVALAIVTSLPGIFGFLVWELRSNWRLYAANRAGRLRPVTVGDHGETMIRLVRPGFHSGTLPRLFGRIRREVRKLTPPERFAEMSQAVGANGPAIPPPVPRPPLSSISPKYADALHHVQVAVERFVEREFVALLETTGALPAGALSVGPVEASSNSIRVDVHYDLLGERPMTLVFQEQSGRLVAGLLSAGWVRALEGRQRDCAGTALMGLYHLCGADLVREQIVSCLKSNDIHYDIAERVLVVWPDEKYELEVRYDLDERPYMVPFPPLSVNNYGLIAYTAEQLLFYERPQRWDDWTYYWTAVAAGESPAPISEQALRVLPLPEVEGPGSRVQGEREGQADKVTS